MTPSSNNSAQTSGRRGRAAPRGGSRARSTPVGFEQRLLARARAVGLERGDRVVVGFSGGRDSLALASGLRSSRDALGIDVQLVHVDHRMRAESGDEAKRAEALAERLGLGWRGVATAGNPVDIHPRVGVEEAARRERYGLLFSIATELRARVVATGHQQQDQAETVLLHLMRGSGVNGAAGMRALRENPVAPPSRPSNDISQEISPPDWPPKVICLWRPLLQETRAAIDAYVDRLGLPWIEDPSNADPSLRRNVLRHEIMPLVEGRFPGATAALARYAELAGADDDALERMAGAALADEVDLGGRLAAAALLGEHIAVGRRMVRRWLLLQSGWLEVSADRIDAVLDLARHGRGNRTLEVGGGWTVSLQRGMLRARCAEPERGGEA